MSWEGYPDPSDDTWEDEWIIHESAPTVVFAFWKARGGRSAALGLGADAEFDVLRICAHRAVAAATGRVKNGKVKGRKNAADRKNKKNTKKAELRFLVEWVGYAEKTWEPAGGLPREMVHGYCEAKGLESSLLL